MKVGISGVGGAVGQGIMKCLSISNLSVEVCAIDVQPLSAGLFRSEESVILPKPEEAGGLNVWEQTMKERDIQALIPGSDHDLLPLASIRDNWSNRDITEVLVSDPELVGNCRDKALTSQILEKAGITAPKSVWDVTLNEARSWAKDTGYPVVVKPRDGYASRNVNVAWDEEELRFYLPRTPNPIIQEWLNKSGESEEFTCAVFVDRDGKPVADFMARRDLYAGTTYHAEIGFWPELHDLLMAIGKELRPKGVLNVQLRNTDRGPVPFELNIRCSGTSAFRAHFGYNEPEMLIRHYVLGEPISAPEVRPGFVFRYWNEIFLEGGAPLEDPTLDGRRGEVLAWP